MLRSPRQSPVAQESGPRRLTKGTPSSNPIHDEHGRFAKSNRVGGRTVGAKDKFFSRRGIGSLRQAYQEFIEQRDGHRKMVDAPEAGIKNPKTGTYPTRRRASRALAKARSKKSLACLVGDWRSSKVAGSGAVS